MLTGQIGNDLKLVQQANLISEDASQAFVPFQDNNTEMIYFKTKTEAKLAIAKFLGKPLATISEAQRLELDEMITDSLHKATLLTRVQDFFQFKLVSHHV